MKSINEELEEEFDKFAICLVAGWQSNASVDNSGISFLLFDHSISISYRALLYAICHSSTTCSNYMLYRIVQFSVSSGSSVATVVDPTSCQEDCSEW